MLPAEQRRVAIREAGQSRDGGVGQGGSPLAAGGLRGGSVPQPEKKEVWGHVPAVPLPLRVSRGGTARGATTTPRLSTQGGEVALSPRGRRPAGSLPSLGGLELARVLQKAILEDSVGVDVTSWGEALVAMFALGVLMPWSLDHGQSRP